MDLVAQNQELSGFTAEATRAQNEVMAAMMVAQKFGRSELRAEKNIMESCSRIQLAQTALYSYPRGKEQITGPSIHLARELARHWGGLDYGIKELEQNDGESLMMAYCWDLVTNVKETKVFTVKHERKARGQISKLTDPRDIYENNANMGARRLRSCILGIIPAEITERAVKVCEQALLKGNDGIPHKDRLIKMIESFSQFGVTQEMLEKRLGHKADVTSPTELVNLQKIYISMKDGMSKKQDWFEIEGEIEKAPDKKAEDLNKKFNP